MIKIVHFQVICDRINYTKEGAKMSIANYKKNELEYNNLSEEEKIVYQKVTDILPIKNLQLVSCYDEINTIVNFKTNIDKGIIYFTYDIVDILESIEIDKPIYKVKGSLITNELDENLFVTNTDYVKESLFINIVDESNILIGNYIIEKNTVINNISIVKVMDINKQAVINISIAIKNEVIEVNSNTSEYRLYLDGLLTDESLVNIVMSKNNGVEYQENKKEQFKNLIRKLNKK